RIALPAPSLYAQFGPGKRRDDIMAALCAIGFDDAFDVAWGAVRATEATRELLRRPGPVPRISSACPVVVRLVQLRFPSLIPHLAPVLPPVELAAREVRRLLGAEAGRVGLFFVSPCTAKVTAIKAPLGYGRSEVDAVLAIKDLLPALKAAMAAMGAMGTMGTMDAMGTRREPSRRGGLPRPAGLGPGIGWARADGELEALQVPGAVSVDGIANVIALLEELENHTLGDLPYIEALACPGGCVGGPMAVSNPHVARSLIRTVAMAAEIAGPEPEASPGSPGGASGCYWTESLQPKPAFVLDRDMVKALDMAEKMETIAESLPGLDCGACGSPDCMALAEDIVKGLASESDCLVRLKERSQKAI
ncbi:MAG: [Fe-Fe] hydrogenase large subunit C-terminal domain-containing protein, partial [Rectinema sp.]